MAARGEQVVGRQGIMAGSTRVLVTHQLQYLPQADVILVLEGGRVAARGSYAELAAQGIQFQKYEGMHGQGEPFALHSASVLQVALG